MQTSGTSAPDTNPVVVTIVQHPAPQRTLADVVIGSVGLVGALLLVAMVLGGLLALVFYGWNRRHPPAAQHLPPVSPLVPDSSSSPSPRGR